MKIRSVLELVSALDSALAWRKKELTALHVLIATRGRDHEQHALRRAAVPILYAHWEGFTKQAATYYLELVLRQKRSYGDLADNFLAIAARGRIRKAAESKKIAAHLPVVDFLRNQLGEPAWFSAQGAIDTESNLSSAVLRDIMSTIGVKLGEHWESKALLMDGSLLRARNQVAHGERELVDGDTYVQLHELVLEMLDGLKIAIENSAARKQYLREPA